MREEEEGTHHLTSWCERERKMFVYQYISESEKARERERLESTDTLFAFWVCDKKDALVY